MSNWLLLIIISYHGISSVLTFPQPDRKNLGTFKCSGTGLESDPTNCSRYYHCLVEEQSPLDVLNCPPTALFDSLEKNCRPKETANCITCKEDGFFKDNSSPYYYIECHGGLAEKHLCEPSGSTFNLEEQGCEVGEEDSKPEARDHPGANNFGYKVHPPVIPFLHPSLKEISGFMNRSLWVSTQAQAGPAKAIGSAGTRNGSEDGGYAHSQASIGAEKTKDQVFKGLGTTGGEYSSVHAMATATGTGKIKEQVKTSDEEASKENPEFDVGPDSIKLGPNKEQVSDEETARIRRRAEIQKSSGKSNSDIQNVHFKHLYGPRALDNDDDAVESEELDEKDWLLDNFQSELRKLATKDNHRGRPTDTKSRKISHIHSEIGPSEATLKVSRSLPGAPSEAPKISANVPSDRKLMYQSQSMKDPQGGRGASGSVQGKTVSNVTKVPAASEGRKVSPVVQQGRGVDKVGRKLSKGKGEVPEDEEPEEEESPDPPPPPPPAPTEPPPKHTTVKTSVKKHSRRYKVIRVPCKTKGAAGSKSGRGIHIQTTKKPEGVIGGRRVFGINKNITYATEPPPKEPFKGGRLVMGINKTHHYPTESPEETTVKIPIESLTQENDTNQDYTLTDGSDPHDDPTQVLHAKPLITITGDEIDETVQIHGSFVDGGDNSLPSRSRLDETLNDALDATATEKIYVIKKDGGSLVVSHHIKIGNGSHNKVYLKLNEHIDQERAENISRKDHVEYWINDAHMTVSKTKDSQVFRYYGPISVTNVTQGKRTPAGIIPEYVGVAHSSGGNGENPDHPESEQNLIKVIVSGIHGNRKKTKIYKAKKGGYDKPRWSSSLAIAGTSSITGEAGGSIAGAHAQDADPNSRTKAESSGSTWSGGSQAASYSYADSKAFHGPQSLCLNPPCKIDKSDALALAANWRVEGASETGKIGQNTKEVVTAISGDPNTKPDYSLKNGADSALGRKVVYINGNPKLTSDQVYAITQDSERLVANPDRPRKKLLRRLKPKEPLDPQGAGVQKVVKNPEQVNSEIRTLRKKNGQRQRKPIVADETELAVNEGAVFPTIVKNNGEAASDTRPIRVRKKLIKNEQNQRGADDKPHNTESTADEGTVVRKVIKTQEEITSETWPLRNRKNRPRQRDPDAETYDTETTAQEETIVRKVTKNQEVISDTRPLRNRKKLVKNGEGQLDPDEAPYDAEQTASKQAVVVNQGDASSYTRPLRGRKKILQRVEEGGGDEQRNEGSFANKQSDTDGPVTDNDPERLKRYRGVKRQRKLKRPTNRRPSQKQTDPFAFEWDGKGSSKSLGASEDSPFEHSFSSAAQSFGTNHEWETGKEERLSDHSRIPVSYQKTFGVSNSSSFKKGLTKNQNGNNSFVAGTSQVVAKKQEYATDERLGSRKHMKKEQLKNIDEKVSSHKGADGENRNYSDTQHGHYEKTNLSEYDHHTGEAMGTIHEKELKHGNTSDITKSSDGSFRLQYSQKKKGFEMKNSSFTGDDIESQENIDKKIDSEKIIAHEGNATSERRSESDKTARSESHAKFSNDSGQEEHLAKSNTLSADAQSSYARDGTDERSHSTNNTYMTDTLASKNMTDELEEALSHQKVRGSEASMSFVNVNGSKKIDEFSTAIGSDTSSASNRTADNEYLANLQTSFSKHKDRQGTEQNLGNNITQTKYVTNEDSDASQKAIFVERVNNEGGEPETEKIIEDQKTKADWSKTSLDVYNDTNSNFSSSVQSESGNSSNSHTGSEKFSVLSEEGKLREEVARARTKHKKIVGPPGSETFVYEYDDEPDPPKVVIVEAQKTPKKVNVEVVYADDEEDYRSPNGGRKNNQHNPPLKISSKTDEYEYSDPVPIKTPAIQTKTQEGSVALAYAGGGYKEGEATAIAASHTIGGESESGALAAAGNGGAKAVVSLKQYPKTQTVIHTEPKVVEYVYET